MESLEDLFVHQLQGAYGAERRLVDSLDEMARNATNERVAAALETHRDETKQHVERLRGVFEVLDLEPRERPAPVVDALDEERAAAEKTAREEELLDLFYIDAGVQTERFELSTYEGLLGLARRLEFDDEVIDRLAANRESEAETLDALREMRTDSDLEANWQRLLP